VFEPGSGHVSFVVDNVAPRQVFSEYFRFPCQSFHSLLHTHQHPSLGAGTIGQIVIDEPNGFSLTQPQVILCIYYRSISAYNTLHRITNYFCFCFNKYHDEKICFSKKSYILSKTYFIYFSYTYRYTYINILNSLF
jgi:hypothetical protein